MASFLDLELNAEKRQMQVNFSAEAIHHVDI